MWQMKAFLKNLFIERILWKKMSAKYRKISGTFYVQIFTIMVGNSVANLGFVWTAALNVYAFFLFISFHSIPFDYILCREFSVVAIFSKYATQYKTWLSHTLSMRSKIIGNMLHTLAHCTKKKNQTNPTKIPHLKRK